jgi:O-acetyl-ADP-ribose deacetylase (regulator of RNase III)
VKSIAFPNISTGVYDFPKPLAADIAIQEVQQFAANDKSIEEIFFVCFDDENYSLYKERLFLEE